MRKSGLFLPKVMHPIVAYPITKIPKEHHKRWFKGPLHQPHSSFFRGEIPFFSVAGPAGSNQIIPGSFASPAFGMNMIQG
jgi:hypothetical protein